MVTQQEWVRDIMCSIISLMSKQNYNGDMCTEGYKYTINAALDNYSQIYWDTKGKKNISLFHKYSKFNEGIYKNIIMSKKAYDYMLAFSNNVSGMNKLTKEAVEKQMNRDLHGEHLTPQSYTRTKLNEVLNNAQNSNLSDAEIMNEVKYALSDAKLCIITKEESKLLDGAGKKFSQNEIDKFLNDYKKVRPNQPLKVNDFSDLKDNPKRSNGFGSIRLHILMENGVEFVNYKGIKQTFAQCIDYLKDGIYYF